MLRIAGYLTRMTRAIPPVYSPLPLRAVLAGLRSAWIGLPAVAVREQFLRWLTALYPDARFVLTDSGTSALVLALRHATRQEKRPIALPAFACFDLATAVLATEAPVVFYDVDPLTLNPDQESLARILTIAPGAIVAAHLYGVPVNVAALRAGAQGVGAIVVDDAAQGVGASWNGHALGGAGDLGVLSFGRGKGITGGEGGALLIPNSSRVVPNMLADFETGSTRSFAAGAKALAQWALGRPAFYSIPSALPFLGLGETHFRWPTRPQGIRDDALALLRHTVTLADNETRARQVNATRLSIAAREARYAVPPENTEAVAGWLRLPLLVPQADVARWRSSAARRLGIYASYPLPLPHLPALRSRHTLVQTEFPGAESLSARLFTLPTHSQLKEPDLVALERWLRGG